MPDKLSEERLKVAMKEAMKEGIREVFADTAMWEAFELGLQSRVSKKAGNLVMRGFWAITLKLGLFLLAGSIVYAVGGWPLLAKLWAAKD